VPEIAEVLAVKQSVEDDLLHRPGVTGVDVGYKYVAGVRTNEVAIRVLVEQKRDVRANQRVPPEINGVRTDVIERRFELHAVSKSVGEIVLMADTGTYNPVKGGISIGPCRVVGGSVFSGTLGAVVTDNATNQPLLLSNFHVMCVDNGWHVGDTMAQPSRVDTGVCPGGVVGQLQRAALTGSVDAAVCSLSGRGSVCEIQDIGSVTGTAAASLGLAVRKRGRTTGLTFGSVDSISLSVNLDYGDGIGVRTLTNQIGLTPDTAHNPKFGDHGDSGSVVVNGSRQVVGLYFAGASDGTGVANPIADVLAALNISVCTAPAKLKFVDDPGTVKFIDDGGTLKFFDDRGTLKFRDDITVKFRDDGGSLKFIDDPSLKFADDPKNKFVDDPKIKFADDPGSMKAIDDVKLPAFDTGNPKLPGFDGGSPAPFVLANPHHSMAWAQGQAQARGQAQSGGGQEELRMQYEIVLSALQSLAQQGGLTEDGARQLEELTQQYSQLFGNQ
jgi:hypothetical protein